MARNPPRRERADVGGYDAEGDKRAAARMLTRKTRFELAAARREAWTDEELAHHDEQLAAEVEAMISGGHVTKLPCVYRPIGFPIEERLVKIAA